MIGFSKILIQRADRIGDALVSLPTVERLKSIFPNATLHGLASYRNAVVFDTHPDFDKTWTWESDLKNSGLSYWNLVKQIREEKYDAYISLWNDPKMAYLGWLAGIPTRVGDGSNLLLRWLYTHKKTLPIQDFTRHQSEWGLRIIESVDIPFEHPEAVGFRISSDCSSKANNLLMNHMPSPSRRVFLFCSTGGSNLPLPDSAVLGFINAMKDQNTQVVLGGPPGDDSYSQLNEPHVLRLIGQSNFKELIALIDACDVYIGPDTGPTHIASILKKPIVFYSPLKSQFPSRWGPLSSPFETIRQEWQCPHGGNERCDPQCFSYVTSDLLIKRYHQVLQPTDSETNYTLKRLSKSIAIVHVVTDVTSPQLKKQLTQLQKQGLRISSFSMKDNGGYRGLISHIKRHNISIIQGNISYWHMLRIRFICGFQ